MEKKKRGGGLFLKNTIFSQKSDDLNRFFVKFLPKNVYFNKLYLISFQVMTKTLTNTFKIARVSTQKLWKNWKCHNFLMLIKVYIFGMEMSQKIYFWYQILLIMMIFWQNGKNSHFWWKNLGQPKNTTLS